MSGILCPRIPIFWNSGSVLELWYKISEAFSQTLHARNKFALGELYVTV